MNKKLVRQFFPDMVAEVEKGNCPICKEKIDKESFRNEISKKEFKISGLCQKCQDNIFGKDNL